MFMGCPISFAFFSAAAITRLAASSVTSLAIVFCLSCCSELARFYAAFANVCLPHLCLCSYDARAVRAANFRNASNRWHNPLHLSQHGPPIGHSPPSPRLHSTPAADTVRDPTHPGVHC